MKTIVIGSEKATNEVKGAATDKTNIRPNEPLKEGVAKGEEKPADNNTKAQQAVPQAEPSKVEIKGELAQQKPALNLDSTIRYALELNRRINQRGKLMETIKTLEEFEVAQKDDADQTESNHYQSCELTIADDKGREFTTKNPFIIHAVAVMVDRLCVDKLAEIEGEIQFPNQK
jgi:hypothetical protein